MSVWLFSVEPWPGKRELGRNTQYVQVLGHQIGPIPGNSWYKLDRSYKQAYHTDWVEAKGPYKFHTHDDEEVAQAIVEKYGHTGIVLLKDMNPSNNKSIAVELEQRARQANQEWYRRLIQDYEMGRELARLGKPGRLEPTAFEVHCYKALGFPAPNSIESIRDQRTQSVKVEVALPQEFSEAAQALKQAAANTPQKGT